jgi:cytochrome c peroxidase
VNNVIYVQNYMSRTISKMNAAPILAGNGGVANLGPATTVSTIVGGDKLATLVLQGKQIFYNAADTRMSQQGYISCAGCHLDGGSDARVFDFTGRGEGLRNTVMLQGRGGTGHGNVHWSANFDEIQDFENEIRELFNGLGFMSDDAFAKGTVADPLGEPKKGQSADLDALAAFVTTLDHVDPSPYRSADGTLTAAAQAGKALFGELGCDFCHLGADMTDSARGMLHDVGTIKPSSGQRSHATLAGIDTPTLLGVWETPPYLHDGSSATLRDVLVAANAKDEHGFISALSPDQVDELVAYLLQIDNELPPRRLPFDPPLVDGGRADGGRDAAPSSPMVPSSGLACTCQLGTRGGTRCAFALVVLVSFALRRRRSAREGTS